MCSLFVELVEFPRAGDGFDRRIRLASSTPDVKALFNNPSYVYKLPEHDETDDVGFERGYAVSGPPLAADMWSPPMHYVSDLGLSRLVLMDVYLAPWVFFDAPSCHGRFCKTGL